MKIKKLSTVLFVCMAFSITACNENNEDKTKSTLYVDLHSLMPTANEKPTPDQPNPINASRYIANAYWELTNTKITWATDYAKPTDNISNIRTWFNNQINVKKCPSIGFSFGTQMQEDDLYVDLTPYLERPNPYVSGNEHWKDLFYDYVWQDKAVLSANNKIVSIPFILDAGSATAVFYNKTLFTENNLQTPKTWKEMTTLTDKVKRLSNIDYAFAPYAGDPSISLSESWAFKYNLAPGFAKSMMSETDYNKDGKTTTNELLRAVLEKKFDPNTCMTAKTLYNQAYKYYTEFLPTGWQSINDWTTKWDEGKVAMKSHGVWYYTNEISDTLRNFDFDMFVPAVVQSDTSSYASNVEYKKISEGYESAVLMSFNIMKPAVEGNEELLEKAIDFLMYLTTPDAITSMVEEYGNGLPAIKTDSYPSLLDDALWFDKKFPQINESEWPLGFIHANNTVIDAAFANWVTGQSTANEFYTILNDEQRKGALKMISSLNIDTTGWEYEK